MDSERIIKGIWFPIEIWEAADLDWNEKILLMEIDSFTSKGLDCFMSNEYIGQFLKVSETKAGNMVNALIKKGYVIKTKFDGRRRFIESNLQSSLMELTKQPRRICKAGSQDLHANNNKYNNDSTNHKDIYKPARFNFLNALLSLGVSEQTARDWMEVRKAKRAANTETAFRNIATEIRKSGMDAESCIRMSAANSWQGFKAEWVQKWAKNGQKPAPRQESAYEHNQRLMRELLGDFNPMGGQVDEQ